MNLSLIYHISANYLNLEKSLKSVFDQTSKNFEVILVDDASSPKVKSIIKEFKFNKLKNFKYINSNQKLSHPLSFNEGVEEASGKYVFYLGSNVVLEPDFIKNFDSYLPSLNNPDFIILNNKKSKISCKSISKVGLSLYQYMTPSIRDKIFNVSFIKKNKIRFVDFNYSPIVYLYQYLNHGNNFGIIFDKMVSFCKNSKYVYNLYDIFQQADYLMKNKNKYTFVKTKQDEDLYEYLIINSIIFTFLSKIHNTYWRLSGTSMKIIGKALFTSNNWLKANIPNWRDNPVIKNNLIKMPKEKLEYFKNFTFKVVYLHKYFK